MTDVDRSISDDEQARDSDYRCALRSWREGNFAECAGTEMSEGGDLGAARRSGAYGRRADRRGQQQSSLQIYDVARAWTILI